MLTNIHTRHTVPYWRLSGFYFFNCAVLGTMLPYWMLFMQSLGYSAWQTGQLTALQMVTAIVAPYVWGEVCDRASSRIRIIQAGNFAAIVIFVCVFALFDHYWALAMAVCASGFCWQGLNAQFELITLNHLGASVHRYGRVRLWGSFGFLSAVWVNGHIIERYSIALLPYIITGLLVTLWLVTLTNRNDKHVPLNVNDAISHRDIWRNPVLWLLLTIFFLSNVSHGSYYGYYSLYLKEEGVNSAIIGNLWTVAVASEMALFAAMPWLIRRFTLRTILLVSLSLTVLRWAGTGAQAGNVTALTALQLLHGVTFSAVHVVAVLLFKKCVNKGHEGKAQALYHAICIGAGQALGVAVGGQIWSYSPSFSFYFSALIAVIGTTVALVYVTPGRITSVKETEPH